MKLTKYLGPDWSFIATDVTEGHAGNSERMVFLYNCLNVRFRNIAGELTLKEGGKIRASFGERINLERGIKINIDSSHILSGVYNASTITKRGKIHLDEDLEIPLPPECKLDIPAGSSLVLKKGQEIIRPEKGKAQVEIPTGIIEGSQYGLRFPENTFDDSLRQFARTPFLIAFQSGWLKLNLCTVHIYYALESNGFEIPEKLKSIPGSNVARDKAYDQIAFWEPARTTGYTRLDIIGANIFDYFEYIFRNEDEPEYRLEGVDANGLGESSRYSTWRTYKMSDHLPMWIELRTDFGEEYLQSISQE